MAENRGGRKDKNNAENGIKMIEKDGTEDY